MSTAGSYPFNVLPIQRTSEVESESDNPLQTPTSVLAKRARPSTRTVKEATEITYVVSVTPATEMKKPTMKHTSKTSTFQLSSSECWDMMKAQMLVKIDAAIEPYPLDFLQYDVNFHIPRIIPKPGIPLFSKSDYSILLQRMSKAKDTPIVTITISHNQADGDKENLPDVAGDSDKVKKRCDPATLPSNVKKNANIQLLQDTWRCPKKQLTCLGMYCFVDEDGSHLPLSHEHLNCWASAILKGKDCASVDKPPNHKMFD